MLRRLLLWLQRYRADLDRSREELRAMFVADRATDEPTQSMPKG